MSKNKIIASSEETKLDAVFAAEAETKSTPPDPFDLDNLRIDQDFYEQVGVKKLLTYVPVKSKPNNQDFVRVRPDTAYRCDLLLVELKDEREHYLVTKLMADALRDEGDMYSLRLAINRQTVPFFWAVKLPKPDGRINEWHRSNAEAAELAEHEWVRVRANMSLRAYDIFVAEKKFPDPEWPDKPYTELLRIAFKDRIIEGPDHPVVKRLRGQI
jgi:hypothetical protein